MSTILPNVDAQPQLAFIGLFSPLSFHTCILLSHCFPFLFILPSLYLSQLYVQMAIPTVHLSIIATLLETQPLPPRCLAVYSWKVPAGYLGLCDQRKLTGTMGGKVKPELNQSGFPLLIYMTTSLKKRKTLENLRTKPCCMNCGLRHYKHLQNYDGNLNNTRVKVPTYLTPEPDTVPSRIQSHLLICLEIHVEGTSLKMVSMEEKTLNRKSIAVTTLNVRTIREIRCREELASNLETYNIEILGVPEHRIVHDERVRYENILVKTLITTSACKTCVGTAIGVR